MSAAKKTAAPKAVRREPAAGADPANADAQDGAKDSAQDAPADHPAEASTPLAKGEVAVRCAKGLERFHRAGMRFGREPTVLVVAELAEGVLERLKAEPRLVVVGGD